MSAAPSTAAAKPAPPSDTQLLDAIERYGWDIDAPGEDGSITWVVYDPDRPLGNGLASSRSLRTALMKAYAATVNRHSGPVASQ